MHQSCVWIYAIFEQVSDFTTADIFHLQIIPVIASIASMHR